MRLVDLLLQTPRNPFGPGQDAMLTHMPSPTYANGIKYNRQMDRTTRSPGSSGTLNDYLTYPLYGYRSPIPQGQPSPTTTSSALTTELIRLLQQQDSNHLSEPSTPNGHGSPLVHAPYPPLQRNHEILPQEDNPHIVAIDKNLNCTTWTSAPLYRTTACSSSPSFFSSSSSSSSSSSASPSSVFGDFNQRRVSMLSSEGSEPEYEPVLSSLVDSDSYESQTSPVNETDAVRWVDQPPNGYVDWYSLKDAEDDHEGYDIDIFNFNLFGSSLDADSQFAPLDGSILPQVTANSALASVSMTPPVSMTTDVVVKSEAASHYNQMLPPSGCHEFKVENTDAFRQIGSLNPTRVPPLPLNDHAKLCNVGNQMDRNGYVLPGYAPMNVASMREESQSEVVKLLLQNRHQWAPQVEKLPPPPHATGPRGSRRKRASASQADARGEATKAKAPRPAKLAPLPPDRRHSIPAPSMKHPSMMIKALEQDDASTNLERLITELMLFESVQDYHATSGNATTKTDAAENSASIFESFVAGHASESELLAQLDLDSLCANENEAMLFLDGGYRHCSNYREGLVKSEPTDLASPSPSSSWLREYQPRHDNFVDLQDSEILYQIRKNDPTFSILEAALRQLPDNDYPTACPPSEATTADAVDSMKDAAMSDHDYCQTTQDLSTSSLCCRPAASLSADGNTGQQQGRQSKRSCDYSTLKSLLLDSNLTEEVRKEVEMDRAKSRKKMSEKLTPPPALEESARTTAYGRGRPADRDSTLLQQQQFDQLNSKALNKLCQNVEAIDGISRRDVSPYSRSTDEISFNDFPVPPNDEDVIPNSERRRLAADDQSHQPDGSQSIHQVEPEVELSTSDANLSGDVDFVFFDSFEDFYNRSNNLDLDSKIDDAEAESDSTNQMSAEFATKDDSKRDETSSIDDLSAKINRHNFAPALAKSRSQPCLRRGTSRIGRWVWKRHRCLSANRTSGRPIVNHEKCRQITSTGQ